MLDKLVQPEVQKYILEHEKADINQLILKGKIVGEVAAKDLAQQIYGRVKAKKKLPEWYSTENIIYPVKISIEQCSSEQTARYKASIVKGRKMVDLTGGAGVDSYYFSKEFDQVTYIEQNPELAEISKHNFSVLGAANINSLCTTSENFLKENEEPFDLIYVDPARRNEEQKKVFRFEDCTPDIGVLMPLLQRGKQVIIKTSPFLDITQALNQLNHVYEIHVVAVNNECKEVLYLLSKEKSVEDELTIYTVNLLEDKPPQLFHFEQQQEATSIVNYELPSKYIYEPNVAILKSGGINSVGNKYNLDKLHPNSQLFTNDKLVADFPGRVFECISTLKYDKKEIKKAVPAGKANITTRNFPHSVAQIRQKTDLKDGGDDYLFATTNMNNEKIILRTKKFNKPMR